MLRFGIKNVRLLFHISFLFWVLASNSICVSAKSNKPRKQGKSTSPSIISNQKGGSRTTDTNYASSGISTTFNVLRYGAKGDGISDDTNAFEGAWAAACKVKGSVMLIPSGSVFLVNPITFLGTNCLPNIVFQLDGKIIAPKNSGAWGSGTLEWLDFTKIEGITIRGNGVIDGQGSVWWNLKESEASYSSKSSETEAKGRMPSTKPTALRFYGSRGVTVTGITIQNSPQTHLKFDNCVGVQVFSISISSPGNSPNTDGIHLQNSQDVVIHTTSLACGDDCISIQTGCSGIYVHNVDCGPGHGISIGGLGKDGTKACVSNVTVRDSSIQNTLNGVRIKTWQGGSGSVQGVMFSNIRVSNVETPIVIDQYYCNENTCPNKTSAVAISGVSFQGIKGTYTENPVHLACSESAPCAGITLSGIVLNPTYQDTKSSPFCWEAFGEIQTPTTPLITCLRNGNPTRRGTTSYGGGSC